MSFTPIMPQNCKYCGMLFMKTNVDAPAVCNCCIHREQKRKQEEKEKSCEINILITLPQEIQKEIEEICINQGISYSKYFLSLHDAATRELHKTEVLFSPSMYDISVIKTEENSNKEKEEAEKKRNPLIKGPLVPKATGPVIKYKKSSD